MFNDWYKLAEPHGKCTIYKKWVRKENERLNKLDVSIHVCSRRIPVLSEDERQKWVT